MTLNDVKFTTQSGGLGRIPEGEDYVSALLVGTGANTNWNNPLGKKYLSLEESESDGIIEGDATWGETWYHIREYFRMAGPSELYVIDTSGVQPPPPEPIYNFTEGRLRQVYYPTGDSFANLSTNMADLIAFSDYFESQNAPLVIITSVEDGVATVDATLPDLRTMGAETVSVLISGDGSGKGKDLTDSIGTVIPAAGTVLGCLARASVHENIGWVGKFPLSQADELQTSIVADGRDWTELSDAVLNDLNDKGYMFFRRHNGVNGYYINDSLTATDELSDYFSLENNRTMQKAKREVRAALLPELQSPLTINEDGTLTADTVAYFQSRAEEPLTRMESAGELSVFRVQIDPDQDVLATDTVMITIRIVPRGVARTISINIGFAANLNA